MLAVILAIWSLISGNAEFVSYAAVTGILLALLHTSDRHYNFNGIVLWGFDLWLLMHILGGLYFIDDHVLYSHVLIEIVPAPYSILKYDQLVHTYCYFIIALLARQVICKISSARAGALPINVITVLCATGIGCLNEIIEFLATVFIENVNVGGYENTALDIIANLLGAVLAVPFFSKLSSRNAHPV